MVYSPTFSQVRWDICQLSLGTWLHLPLNSDNVFIWGCDTFKEVLSKGCTSVCFVFFVVVGIWHQNAANIVRSVQITANSPELWLFAFNAPVRILKVNHFWTSDFQAITQNRSNPGLFSDSQRPRKKHVCIFSCSCICSDGLRGKNTDVSPAVCPPNPQPLLHLSVSALSSVCVRGEPLPCVPSREQSPNNDAFLALYLHAGPPTSKQKSKKQSKACSVCVYLPVSVTVRQIGRRAAPVMGPLRSAAAPKSYLHYLFYEKTNKQTLFWRGRRMLVDICLWRFPSCTSF